MILFKDGCRNPWTCSPLQFGRLFTTIPTYRNSGSNVVKRSGGSRVSAEVHHPDSNTKPNISKLSGIQQKLPPNLVVRTLAGLGECGVSDSDARALYSR